MRVRRLAPSLSAVIRKVTDYSNAQRLDRHDLAARVEALPAADIDQVCNGHDLLGFLHTLLRPKRSPALSLDELTRRVAISCESGWLEQTAMWKALRTWEDAHPGFAVLRPA